MPKDMQNYLKIETWVLRGGPGGAGDPLRHLSGADRLWTKFCKILGQRAEEAKQLKNLGLGAPRRP